MNMKSSIFWGVTFSPRGNFYFRVEEYTKEIGNKLTFCLAYLLILKIKSICSSETSVNIYRTTQCYISEKWSPDYMQKLPKSFFFLNNNQRKTVVRIQTIKLSLCLTN
jgi:hypothetical protein